MEGLLTLLLFAGFFYFMMRFGCGAHAVHGHGGGGPDGHAGHGAHGGQGEHAQHGEHAGHGGRPAAAPPPGETATDPVCGMEVAPGEGYTMTHAGHEFRLCSRVCLDRFEADPDHYAAVPGSAR